MNILHDDSFRDMMEYDILGGYNQMKKRHYTDEEIKQRICKMYDLDGINDILVDDKNIRWTISTNSNPIEYYTMEREITDKWFIIEDEIAFKTKKFEDEVILSFDDKELLIEYAPKLFNTWKDTNTLKEIMFNFVDKVYQYKFMKSPNNMHNQLNNNLSPTYAKHNHRKIQALSDKLKEALDLMSRYDCFFEDHVRVGSTIEDNFREKLPKSLATRHEETVGNLVVRVISEIIENPEKYVMKKVYIPTTETKKEIREYLISLKLNEKSNEINNFMKEIK